LLALLDIFLDERQGKEKKEEEKKWMHRVGEKIQMVCERLLKIKEIELRQEKMEMSLEWTAEENY
jgi:hypothetical protein